MDTTDGEENGEQSLLLSEEEVKDVTTEEDSENEEKEMSKEEIEEEEKEEESVNETEEVEDEAEESLEQGNFFVFL